MKNKYTGLQAFVLVLLMVVLVSSCSKINQAADFITNPSAKQEYEREFKEGSQLFELWENQSVKALNDSIMINMPYTESGKFFPRTFPVYSYEVAMNLGERLQV